MWILAFEKNEFLRNIWFSVHQYSQIRMQTFVEVLKNDYDDWKWHDFVSAYLFHPVKYQSLSLPCFIHYFSFSCQRKNSKLTWTISCSNKALMNFHRDSPNSYVPANNLLEFLIHALSITSYQHSTERICKTCL